jgi:hypothetical protein
MEGKQERGLGFRFVKYLNRIMLTLALYTRQKEENHDKTEKI